MLLNAMELAKKHPRKAIIAAWEEIEDKIKTIIAGKQPDIADLHDKKLLGAAKNLYAIDPGLQVYLKLMYKIKKECVKTKAPKTESQVYDYIMRARDILEKLDNIAARSAPQPVQATEYLEAEVQD